MDDREFDQDGNLKKRPEFVPLKRRGRVPKSRKAASPKPVDAGAKRASKRQMQKESRRANRTK